MMVTWSSVIRRSYLLWIASCLLCLYYGSLHGLDLFKALDATISVPKSSPSYKAQQAFVHLFPTNLVESFPASTIISISERLESNSNVDLESDIVKRFIFELINELFDVNSGRFVRHIHSYFYEAWQNDLVLDSNDIYLVQDNNGFKIIEMSNLTRHRYMSKDRAKTEIVLEHNFGRTHKQLIEFFDQTLPSIISKVTSKRGNFPLSVTFTNDIKLLELAKDSTIYDFEHADMIGIPLAWLLLFFACGLPSLLILITLPTSILFSFYLVSLTLSTNVLTFTKMPEFAPSLLVSISVALNIDYALFFLARFRTEMLKEIARNEILHVIKSQEDIRQEHTDPYAYEQERLKVRKEICTLAWDRSLASSSKTIIISGIIFLVTTLSLSIVPSDIISSLGVGLFITNVVTILVNITFLPAWTYLFSGYFFDHIHFSLVDAVMRLGKWMYFKISGKYLVREEFLDHESYNFSILRHEPRFELGSASNEDNISVDEISRRRMRHLNLEISRFEEYNELRRVDGMDVGFAESRIQLFSNCFGSMGRAIAHLWSYCFGVEASQVLNESFQASNSIHEELLNHDKTQISSTEINSEDSISRTEVRQSLNLYTRLGFAIKQHPIKLIIACMLLWIPFFILALLRLKRTDDQIYLLPYSNPFVQESLKILNHGVSPALLSDYKMVLASNFDKRYYDIPFIPPALGPLPPHSHDIFIDGINLLLLNSKTLRDNHQEGNFTTTDECFDDNLLISDIGDLLGFSHGLLSCNILSVLVPACRILPRVVDEIFEHKYGPFGAKLFLQFLWNICPNSCVNCRDEVATSKYFYNISAFVSNATLNSTIQFTSAKDAQDSFESPTFMLGKTVSWTFARDVIQQFEHDSVEKLYYRKLFKSSIGINHTSHLFNLFPKMNPYGNTIHTLIKTLRHQAKLIPKLALDSHDGAVLTQFVGGSVTALFDQEDLVYLTAPIIMFLAVVFTVVGTSLMVFRSAVLGPRLLFTILYTLIFVAGSAAWKYEDGLYWIVPIVGLPVIVGCTLDYDSYIVARIYESRLMGMDTSSAVIKGLEDTAQTITLAGVIMTVAFGSMLFSSVIAINQIGFVLVLCSIIDTFLVRSILVPALMFEAAERNWWPSELQAPTQRLDELGRLQPILMPTGAEHVDSQSLSVDQISI